MPQFMWEGLFPILYVLVPGVVLALFAAYYQNRRKKEIQIEGKLAVERIDGYELILNCLYEAQSYKDASLEEERLAGDIFQYFDAQPFHPWYPNAFKDEATFDAFYKRIENLKGEWAIYLDGVTARQLSRSISFYTQMKLWLDAFCDTEHAVDLKLKEDLARKNIDWMYKLTGMLVSSRCTQSFAEFEKVVCNQLNHFSLTYRKHRLRKLWWRIGESVMYRIDAGSRKNGLWGKICKGIVWLYVGKDGRSMTYIMEIVVQVMRYVHFSDRFTPEEYFENKRVPDEKEIALFGEVYMVMVHRS